MKERPIIFNSEMVRAVMEGSKVQTRRVLSPRQLKMIDAAASVGECYPLESGHQHPNSQSYYREWCPFGAVGDRLWVRETWTDVNLEGIPAVAYRADSGVYSPMDDESFLNEDGSFNYDDPRVAKYHFAAWYGDVVSGTEGNWRPSIHMPRWASRITLEITGVRVERLQDISEADARAEGTHWSDGKPNEMGLATELVVNADEEFAHLWRSIYGEESWQANPWVWVIEFKRVEGE
ncbi:hypothetical protein PUG42_05810 [Erwiniaceae bacterium L1_54_3]|nr:hypothetical protein [Erwiniaceae bacterium L1_54_3]